MLVLLDSFSFLFLLFDFIYIYSESRETGQVITAKIEPWNHRLENRDAKICTNEEQITVNLRSKISLLISCANVNSFIQSHFYACLLIELSFKWNRSTRKLNRTNTPTERKGSILNGYKRLHKQVCIMIINLKSSKWVQVLLGFVYSIVILFIVKLNCFFFASGPVVWPNAEYTDFIFAEE